MLNGLLKFACALLPRPMCVDIASPIVVKNKESLKSSFSSLVKYFQTFGNIREYLSLSMIHVASLPRRPHVPCTCTVGATGLYCAAKIGLAFTSDILFLQQFAERGHKSASK